MGYVTIGYIVPSSHYLGNWSPMVLLIGHFVSEISGYSYEKTRDIGSRVGRACRGSSPGDNHPNHYAVFSDVVDLSDCKAKCESSNACVPVPILECSSLTVINTAKTLRPSEPRCVYLNTLNPRPCSQQTRWESSTVQGAVRCGRGVAEFRPAS